MTQPDVIGQHYGYDDVRGWLTFSSLPAELQRQVDQTQNADHERRDWLHRPRVRPATNAEKVLLAHLGFQVPASLTTTVVYPSGGIRRLEWPALEAQRKAMQ